MAVGVNISEALHRGSGGDGGDPERLYVNKTPYIMGTSSAAVATVAGRWTSLGRYHGTPREFSIPGSSGAVPTRTTEGAIRFRAAPAERVRYLVAASAVGSTTARLVLYDRLLHIGGLSATVFPITINSPDVTRENIGSQIWCEVYTQIGATNRDVTISYTNELGTAGRTATCTLGGTALREAQRLVQATLQAGDLGVRSIESVDVSGTLTSGNWGITVLRPLVSIPCTDGGNPFPQFYLQRPGGPVALDNNTCLALMLSSEEAVTFTLSHLVLETICGV